MLYRLFFLPFLLANVALASDAVPSPELIFKTGFEGDSQVVPEKEANDQLVGRDSSPGCKSDVQKDLGIEQVRIEYTHGDPSKRYGKIIPEPGNEKNRVLQFWIGDSWFASNNQVKARVQADFYNFKPGYKEFYQSVRVFLHPDMAELRKYPNSINWLTIAEFWNNRWWNNAPHGFRITLGIGKPSADESDLNFILDAQGPNATPIWKSNNTEIKVPIGQWFTLDYYFKEGDAQTGRFYVAMTPDGGTMQVVFDVESWTHNVDDPAPDGISDWNPMKLYTSKELVAFMKDRGKPLQIYWDDIELWKNRRPTGFTPPPPIFHHP